MKQNKQDSQDSQEKQDIKDSEKIEDIKESKEPIRTKVEILQDEVDKEKEAKLMVLADFQNYKKRAEKEKIEWMNMSSKSLTLQLIEIMDDYSRAKTNDADNQAKLVDGYEMILNKIYQIIEEQGAEKIDIKAGDKFDPTCMEALTTVPVDNKKDDNKVVHIDESGYKNKHKDQVLKMAKVVIGKK